LLVVGKDGQEKWNLHVNSPALRQVPAAGAGAAAGGDDDGHDDGPGNDGPGNDGPGNDEHDNHDAPPAPAARPLAPNYDLEELVREGKNIAERIMAVPATKAAKAAAMRELQLNFMASHRALTKNRAAPLHPGRRGRAATAAAAAAAAAPGEESEAARKKQKLRKTLRPARASTGRNRREHN